MNAKLLDIVASRRLVQIVDVVFWHGDFTGLIYVGMEPGLRASAEAANLALFYCCTLLHPLHSFIEPHNVHNTYFTSISQLENDPVYTLWFIQGCPTHFPEQFQDKNLTLRTHESRPQKYTVKVVCFKITPLNRSVVKNDTIILFKKVQPIWSGWDPNSRHFKM